MGSIAWELDHSQSFQINLFGSEVFKWPETARKEHRHDVNVQLINKSRFEALLGGTRATDNGNLSGPCGRFGLFNAAFDTFGHECESQLASLLGLFFRSFMGKGDLEPNKVLRLCCLFVEEYDCVVSRRDRARNSSTYWRKETFFC